MKVDIFNTDRKYDVIYADPLGSIKIKDAAVPQINITPL